MPPTPLAQPFAIGLLIDFAFLPPAFFWLKSYPEPMGLWISVLGSFVAAIGSTLLFNAVDAKPELVVLAYVFIAFVGGAGIGIFAEQIPEPPKWLRDLSRGKAHKP